MRLAPVIVLALAGAAAAQDDPPPVPRTDREELRALLLEQQRRQEELNRRYEERIRRLEAELAGVEAERELERAEDDLDELLRLAEAAGPPPVPRPVVAPNALNPRISVIPDFVARFFEPDVKAADLPRFAEAFPELFDETDPFVMRETEIELRAAVSPEADAVAILAVGDEETAFEEVYVVFHTLPYGLALKIGKFLLDFGRANRVHTHDLAQVDRPIVHRLLFGDDGTSSAGVSLSKVLFTTPAGGLLPTHSELTVEAINTANEEAPLFGDEPVNEAGVNLRWRNFWELSPAADLETGLSFLATGNNKNGANRASRAAGADVTVRLQDSAPGAYDAWLFQAEVIGSSVEGDEDTVDALGGYLTVQRQLDPQWYAGVRLDAAESPAVDDADVLGVSPYVTHDLNEFIRLRLQYDYRKATVGGADADSHGLALQLTWVFGSHPPEPYWVTR